MYSSTILEWIAARSKAGKPVSIPEIIDAVYSIVFTPSPRSWRRVFRAVVHEQGVQVEGGDRKPHYEHKLPITALWLLKALELNGGSVGGGAWRRFQPSISRDVEVELIYSSLRNLLSIVREINAETKLCREQSEPEKLPDISRSMIVAMSKSVRNGGLHGVGELHAHHVRAVLSLLGIVKDPVHSLNASISRGTDTAAFVARTYQMSSPSQINTLMRFLSSQRFGSHGKLSPQEIENLICELGRKSKEEITASRSSQSRDYLWSDCLYRSMRFFDIDDGGKVVARSSGSDGAGVVRLRTSSHVLSLDEEHALLQGWYRELTPADREVSFLVLDHPRPNQKSKNNKFRVEHSPWWQRDWVFVDDGHPVLAIKDEAERKRHAKRRKHQAKARRKASAGSRERVSVAAIKRTWRAQPPRDFDQKRKYRNVAADVMWRLSEVIAQTDIRIVSSSHSVQWRRHLERLGAEACLDLSRLPMTEADREEFVASTNHFLDNPDCGIVDPFVLGVHEIATGKRDGVVAPSSRTRSEARRRRRHDDESSDDDEKDDTYDALVDGGYTTESYFHIGKLFFLRYGMCMKLSERHSSVADHVSMASQALGVSGVGGWLVDGRCVWPLLITDVCIRFFIFPQLEGLNRRNFVLKEHGRHYSCCLEYQLGDDRIVHRSDELVFGKKGSKTHLQIGAVLSSDSDGDAIPKVLHRTKQHAQFAAAAVAVQKLNPGWFERKFLSSGSFHILFPSQGQFDPAYEYDTRHKLKSIGTRNDPIAFLVRRDDSIMLLDASAMQEKDRLETNGSNCRRGAWCKWSEGHQKFYNLHENLEIKYEEFKPMSRSEQLDRNDRYCGDDEALITHLSESSAICFQLDQTITVKAQKVMNEGQHEFLPKGWCVAETIRKSGDSAGSHDKYYFSPRGYKFRSRVEVERFLRCRLSVGGANEVLAKHAFDSGRCMVLREEKGASQAKRQKKGLFVNCNF